MAGRNNQIAPEREHVSCAHMQCPHPAVVYVKVNAHYAKLCKQHYEFHVQQEADDFVREKGLDTREKKFAFIKEKLVGIGRRFGRVQIREPGEEG